MHMQHVRQHTGLCSNWYRIIALQRSVLHTSRATATMAARAVIFAGLCQWHSTLLVWLVLLVLLVALASHLGYNYTLRFVWRRCLRQR